MTSAPKSHKIRSNTIIFRAQTLFNPAPGFATEVAVDSEGTARMMGSDIIGEHGFGKSTRVLEV
jgi:hypothetical protein